MLDKQINELIQNKETHLYINRIINVDYASDELSEKSKSDLFVAMSEINAFAAAIPEEKLFMPQIYLDGHDNYDICTGGWGHFILPCGKKAMLHSWKQESEKDILFIQIGLLYSR